MSFQEEYLFWRLAHYFISDQEYRIVQLSKEQNEIWLEKMENKEAQTIRLLRYNLDWSNWMQKDIELTAMNGERIRKQLAKSSMNVVNIYVTPYPPVDDYEFRISEPFQFPSNGKTRVQSIIFDRAHYEQGFQKVQKIFHDSISFPVEENYSENDVDKLKLSALSIASNKAKEEKRIFNQGKPFFTYVFMMIQVAVFLFLESVGSSTDTSTLIKYGAKFNPLILEGEWWRFFTPIILHIGILHLLMNTVSLYYLGTVIERIFGKSRFLLIYLIAGFGGSIASFIFSPSLSAGASGAIYGLFGALLYFGVIYPQLFFRTMGFNLLLILGINLMFGFSMPSIDMAGHIGGLIAGFLAAGIVHFPKKKRLAWQLLFLVITAGLFAGLLNYGFNEPGRLLNEQSALIMAQEYIETEDYEQAQNLLQDYSKEKDVSAEVYFLLSYAEINLKEFAQAKEHLQLAIKERADFHEAYYNLALIYIDEKNYSEAKKCAEKAVELKPEQTDYTNLLKEINNYIK
ncbi:rhomboid family protein [Cytobacillus massiliigabonensis]|uniref:rhomboid family protein n=1 Tax=Cytobacillus massiliigabonensis TaxID=1871011 RepID=UPI000C864D7D|nr:rhomboid family intramembrane serine protease [Cytobacillus massiliigabonensis]